MTDRLQETLHTAEAVAEGSRTGMARRPVGAPT
jgi:hypothetical protein